MIGSITITPKHTHTLIHLPNYSLTHAARVCAYVCGASYNPIMFTSVHMCYEERLWVCGCEIPVYMQSYVFVCVHVLYLCVYVCLNPSGRWRSLVGLSD